MHRSLHTLLLVAAFFPSVQGTWTEIFGCDSRDDTNERVKFSIEKIQSMAQDATRVRICTSSDAGANARDCTTSKKDSYPIENLRRGITLLSHPYDGGICDARCVRDIWDTPSAERAKNLEVKCPRSDNPDYNYGGSDTVYWACGNLGGTHFAIKEGPNAGSCAWRYQAGGALSVYIDDKPASTSTTTTTTHKLNPSVAALEETVDKLTYSIAEMTKELATARQETLDNKIGLEGAAEGLFTANKAIADLVTLTDSMTNARLEMVKTMTDTMAEAQAKIESLQSTVESNNAVIAALKGLSSSIADAAPSDLLAKGSSCSSGNCAPSVSTDGDNVLFTASKGSIKIDTKDCGSVDVCSISKAVDAIKKGLAEM